MTFLVALLALTLSAQVVSADSDATAELVAALQDDDPDIRQVAAMLLGDAASDAPTVVSALASSLADREEAWRVRAAGASSLGCLGQKGVRSAVPALLQAAWDARSDWRVRAAAVEGLWSIDRGSTLRSALAESKAPLVIQANRTLVSFEPQRGTVPALLASLEDPDERIRRLGALALLLAEPQAP